MHLEHRPQVFANRYPIGRYVPGFWRINLCVRVAQGSKREVVDQRATGRGGIHLRDGLGRQLRYRPELAAPQSDSQENYARQQVHPQRQAQTMPQRPRRSGKRLPRQVNHQPTHHHQVQYQQPNPLWSLEIERFILA